MRNDFDFDVYTGKNIVLHMKDGSSVSGRYVGYTPAYDNDPEITSVNLHGKWNYEIDAPDIDHIEIVE